MLDRQLLSQWQAPIRWGTVVLLVAVLFGAVTSIVDPSLFNWASDGARGEVIIDHPGGGNHDPGDLLSLPA